MHRTTLVYVDFIEKTTCYLLFDMRHSVYTLGSAIAKKTLKIKPKLHTVSWIMLIHSGLQHNNEINLNQTPTFI